MLGAWTCVSIPSDGMAGLECARARDEGVGGMRRSDEANSYELFHSIYS